jgi:uncharacterized protein (DUF4415 family)
MPRKPSTKRSQENPSWTRATFDKSRPATEVLPKLVGPSTAEILLRPRGRPKSASPKVAVSLRMPSQTLARWRATGPGWQTRMVDTLDRAARSFKK